MWTCCIVAASLHPICNLYFRLLPKKSYKIITSLLLAPKYASVEFLLILFQIGKIAIILDLVYCLDIITKTTYTSVIVYLWTDILDWQRNQLSIIILIISICYYILNNNNNCVTTNLTLYGGKIYKFINSILAFLDF